MLGTLGRRVGGVEGARCNTLGFHRAHVQVWEVSVLCSTKYLFHAHLRP